jgi:hypothetical protein
MKKQSWNRTVLIVCGILVLMITSAQRCLAEERDTGFSSGVNIGVARFFDGDLGTGFSGRVFLEYAPYIHEIALKLSGGYFRFVDEVVLGYGAFQSEEEVIFEDLYLTGGVVYRFSRGKTVPFATANLGVYRYQMEEVNPAPGPVISGIQVSPYDTVDYKEGYDLGVNLGGGVEFFISKTTSISMELLAHKIFGEVDDAILEFTAMFRFFPRK